MADDPTAWGATPATEDSPASWGATAVAETPESWGATPLQESPESWGATPVKESNESLLAEQKALGRKADLARIAANTLGAVSDYLAEPLSNPIQTLRQGLYALDPATEQKRVDAGLPAVPPFDGNAPLVKFVEQAEPGNGAKLTDAGIEVPVSYPDMSGNKVGQAAQGAVKAGLGFAEGMTALNVVATLPEAGAVGPVGGAVRTLFAEQMGGGVPDAATRLGEASTQGVGPTTEAALDLAGRVAIPGLAMVHELLPLKTNGKNGSEVDGKVIGQSEVSEFGGVPPVQTSGVFNDLPKGDANAPTEETSTGALDRNAGGAAAGAGTTTTGGGEDGGGAPAGTPADHAGAESAQPGAVPVAPTMLKTDRFPVVDVPLKDLKLSEDVPNFKAEAAKETGVVEGQELGGKYERLGTGAITVYERLNGDKEVISGRHRFDLAKRTGETDIPAQVVREANGFTPQMAQVLDAEMNIRDGQGTVGDYANYFRNTDMAPDQAAARGLLSRAKGKAGWDIGKNASEDVYALFRGGKISEGQAQAIAKSAPLTGLPDEGAVTLNTALQRVGTRSALNGAAPQEIQNFIQAVRLKTRGMSAEQLDLFGGNDAALNEAEKLGKRATAIQRDLDKQIKATDNAARHADQAKSSGLRFDKDPIQILKDNALLRYERNRWDNWALHHELVDQVTAADNMQMSEADEAFGDAKKGINQHFVRTIADDVERRLPGVKVNVVQSVKDLPIGYRLEAEKALARGKKVRGFYDRNTQQGWVVADHVDTAEQARLTILEETLGHHGMDRLVRPVEMERLYDSIRMARPERLKQLAKDYEADLTTAEGRAKVVREYVAKESRLLDEKSTLWVRIRDVLTIALKRAGLLPQALIGHALDAQMRVLARRATGQLSARRWVDPQSIPSSKPDLSFAQESGSSQGNGNGVGPERQARQFGLKVKGDDDLAPALKAGVSEYNYSPRSNETDLSAAQRIVKEQGVDSAIGAFKDNTLWGGNGAVQSVLGKVLIKALAVEESVARGRGDVAGSEAALGKQVDLVDHELRRSTDIAQSLQAMSLYGDMTPSGILKHAQKTFEDVGRKMIDKIKPALGSVKKVLDREHAGAVEDVSRDAAVNKAARAAVDEHVEGSLDTHKAVVMELAEPWASSPAIMNSTRDLVRARATEILNGSAPAERSSTHLRAIMGDLSKRAASIAAAHFQGAEPGVTLRDKLKTRLGLSTEHSRRLAESLENQFTKMVEAAKARIPERIARARAKQLQPYNPNDLREPVVDREIRRQLQEMNINLGKSLRTQAGASETLGRSLADRVVQTSGMTGAKADALREVFQRRFEALATARKQSALAPLLKERGARPLKSAAQRLIELSNLGGLTDQRIYEAVREKFGLPVFTPEMGREITRRANDLQRKPEGFQRDRATVDLLNFIAKQKGISRWELPMSIWYANVLSGVTTPVHILVDNVGSLAGNLAVAAVRGPGAVPALTKAVLRGVGKGLDESRSVLKTGYVTGIKGSIHQSPVLELNPFSGPLAFLNAYKYVGRLLSATHVATFKPAWELKSTLVAHDVARSEGLRGPALEQRVADILGNTDARQLAARAQAVAEGVTGLDLRRRTSEIIEQQREASTPGITEQARDYALRATYLNKPYGALGWTVERYSEGIIAASKASPLLAHIPRLAIPFTRIVSNILNEKLNYTPVGAFRAWRAGKRDRIYGQDTAGPRLRTDQAELYAKAIVGTMALGALAAAAAKFVHQGNPPFAITGAGPATPEERHQLMQSGWRPNSIKVGDRYISYSRLPIGYGLAVLGNYMDAVRYRKLEQQDVLDKTAYAVKGLAWAVTHQSFLEGVGQILDATGNESTKKGGEKLASWAAKNGSSFIVPTALRQVDKIFEPAIPDPKGVKAQLLAQVPFVRRQGMPTLNVLGEPVKTGLFDYDLSATTKDPVWRVVAAKQAWIPEVEDPVMVGDRKRDPGNYRALTPAERYSFVKESGARIRSSLLNNLPTIATMNPAQAKVYIQKVAEEERKAVKARWR